MDKRWAVVAERVADALGLGQGEVIQVRDRSGRYEVVQEVLLAIERRGATPLPELLPSGYLPRLLASTAPALLATWDRHRLAWGERTDRALVLGELDTDFAATPPAAVDAWRLAVQRLSLQEARRRTPYLLIAVPTAARAERLGMDFTALENAVLPALTATPAELGREVARVLAALRNGRTLTLRSGQAGELRLALGARRWLSDAGTMPPLDSLPAGVQPVQNLPAGAVYTTVEEAATQGTLWLPQAAGATSVVLRFEGGRVVAIEAASGGDALADLFDGNDGESRRVSHIGIGLNMYLQHRVGWSLVDEHQHGCLLIALGENRYLGGQNASSLNVDFAIPEATLLVDGRVVIAEGRLLA